MRRSRKNGQFRLRQLPPVQRVHPGGQRNARHQPNTVRCKQIVNAAGPWVRSLLESTSLAPSSVPRVRLVLLARIRLAFALVVVARYEGLLLHRDEAGLLPETGKAVVVLAFFRSHFIVGPRLRLVLTELLLRGGDQAKVMLGVLIIILGGYRVA